MDDLSRRTFLAGAGAGVAGLVAARAMPASALFTTSRGPSVVLPPTTVDFVAPAVVDGVGLVATLGCGTAAPVGIVAWPRANPSSTTFSGLTLTHPGPTGLTNTARVVVPGVGIDGRAWSYYPVADWYGSGPAVAGPTWTLPRRPPPGQRSAFTFAFGSCFNSASDTAAWTAVGSGHQFFAHLGDWTYPDGAAKVQSEEAYVASFRLPLGTAAVRSVLCQMPLEQIGDDHDDGQDGACLDPAWPLGVPYPTPGTHDCGFKDYALRAQAAVFPTCNYPAAPSYRNWSIGEVDFWLCDSRLGRDLPHLASYPLGYRSQLGEAQTAWLNQTMPAATGRLAVVFIPMTPTWDLGAAGANQVTMAERSALWQLFSGLGKPVLVLTGDRHAGAVGRWGNVVEMLAGPMGTGVRHTIPDWSGNGLLWANATTAARTDKDTLIGRVAIDTTTTPGVATLQVVQTPPSVATPRVRYSLNVPIP